MSNQQALSISYQNQNNWKEIQSFLPLRYQLTDAAMPKEESWEWQDNLIHLDTYRNPSAKAKVILFHGVGTNGRQMTTIIGKPLADDGFEVIALDMPLYGETAVNRNQTITFSDWVECGNDYLNYEFSRDDRPIFLYGLSAGGIFCCRKESKGERDYRNDISRSKRKNSENDNDQELVLGYFWKCTRCPVLSYWIFKNADENERLFKNERFVQ